MWAVGGSVLYSIQKPRLPPSCWPSTVECVLVWSKWAWALLCSHLQEGPVCRSWTWKGHTLLVMTVLPAHLSREYVPLVSVFLATAGLSEGDINSGR